MKQPTKAIIPAAGFGTRFLPQTKAMPKEMMPIIDKPVIQYVVEELVEAGIKDIIIVGSSNKRAIEDHFDTPSAELLSNLISGGEKKKPYIDLVENIANMANFIYVRQKGPYGNATPILSAAHLIGDDEPFIYKWADDFFMAETSATRQLLETYKTHGGGVFACKRVAVDKEYDQYGIAAGEQVDDTTLNMKEIFEKPGKDAAPSNLASVSEYLLPGAFVDYVEKAATLHNQDDGEFTFQPMIQQMIEDGHEFYAREIVGGRFYDTGNPLEYLKTTIDFGLNHPEFGDALRDYMSSRISS
jgi:UTP--glucose-1-phosphate uridylyltransferase